MSPEAHPVRDKDGRGVREWWAHWKKTEAEGASVRWIENSTEVKRRRTVPDSLEKQYADKKGEHLERKVKQMIKQGGLDE